ncbi:MAG: RNA polymerase factor sigma-54 [Chitinophagaceae bacterium]|jgi:RNA polymerase sigma-54 factor
MALSQGLYQKQLLKLSPQQIQLMKLLQVPTANLEERIKEELEENPALEVAEDEDKFEDEFKDEFEENNNNEEELDGSEDEYENLDLSEYLSDSDDEIPDYRTNDDHYGDEDKDTVIPIKNEASFFDVVLSQLNLLLLDETEFKIAEQIVGSLDEDGYLRRETINIVDDLAFRQNIITTEKIVEKIIKKIQDFEPAGVAARDLQECLLLQLYRKKENGEQVDKAIIIIQKYFDDFSKRHFAKLKERLELTDDDMKNIIAQVTSLNPKPGGSVVESNMKESYIIPDFTIENINGKLELTLNSTNAPTLRISEGFKEMIKGYEMSNKKNSSQKEAIQFLKQKIDGAKWFIEMIKQRQETLMNTMTAIINHQKKFFLTGDETHLVPMILKDIAEPTGLDISTISRVVNSKFVQTEFGTIRLKYFFSEGLQTDSGEEASSREIKKVLSDIILAEDKQKPLADEVLTEMLNDKGYNIARRTVAKYREQLNIPVARLRKEL